MEEHTRGLLADYADLINRHGVDSPEEAAFILATIDAELRRRLPEIEAAIRRIKEAKVVSRETMQLNVDI